MFGDSFSVFKTTKVVDHSISEHHSLVDISLKQAKEKCATIFYNDYLIRRAPIKNFFRKFIFETLFIQLIVIGVMSNFSGYWGQEKPTERAVRFFAYIFLVLSPPKQTPIFQIMFISLVILFLIMIFLYYAANYSFKKYRSINLGLCYAARYSSLIISTVFYSISHSFCGEYLSNVFFHSNKNSNSTKNQITSFCILIFFIFVNIFLFDNLLFKHYDISFQNILFKIWNPWSLIRLYCLMGLNSFICHILPTTSKSFESKMPLIPTISLVLSSILFLMESLQINWVKNSQHIKILTALFSNMATSLSVLLDILLSKDKVYHPRNVLFISTLSSILGYFISSYINKISINASLKRLNSPYYPYLLPGISKHKKKQKFIPKHSKTNQNQHLKLESKSLDKVNSSFLFKFKRFPSDDSLTSSDDENDIHKSKSNEPRALSSMFNNVSKDLFASHKHSDDPKDHFLNRIRKESNKNDNNSNSNNNNYSDANENYDLEYDYYYYEYEEYEDDFEKIDDYKSLKSVRFASTVFKDLCVGFMYGNENVIYMNHLDRILEKFPNDTDIFFFFAKHRSVFNLKSSISIEEIMEKLSPHSLFNPIQSLMYLSINRNLEPASIHSLSIMENSIKCVDLSFLKVIDSIRSVYNLILYELTSSLPKAVLVFQHRYNKMLVKLFSFVQKYPGSSDSKFYVKLFETFFPNAPERKELMFWLNFKPNYSVNDISFFPSHASLMINNPECFAFKAPSEIHNEKDDKPKGRVFPDFLDSFQNQNNFHLKNVKGPYMFALNNRFLKISLFISVLFPLITMLCVLVSDNKYLLRSNHLIEGYSYLWRIDLMNNCLYPTLFFKNSTNFWDDQQTATNYSTIHDYDNDDDENDDYYYDDEHYHVPIGTMSEYMLDKLRIISSLQSDLLLFSKGCSPNFDAQIFNEMNKIFQYQGNQHDNKTIYEIIMFSSFVAEDFLTEDNLYLKHDPDITYGMQILQNVWINSSYVSKMLYHKLKDIDIFTDSILPKDDKNVHKTSYYLISQYILLFGAYIFLTFSFKAALSKFDLFFFSLRETSKPAVTRIYNICQKYSQFIGHGHDRNQRKPSIHPYHFCTYFAIPTVIIYLLIFLAIGLFVLMNDCYERQTRDIVDTYEKLTIAYHNFTSLIIDIIILQYYNNNLNDTQKQVIINEIGQINYYYQGLNWFLESDFPFYCTLCSLVDIMMSPNNKTNSTYYSSLFEWLGMSQFYVNNALRRENVAKKLIYQFFGDVDFMLIEVFEFTKDKISETVVFTGNIMLFLFLFYLFLVILLVIVIYNNLFKADSPFISMINMLGRLPENALSRDTCKILGHHKLEFASKRYYFDPSYYEQVLKTFPHPIIVIDRLMHVDYYNTSAKELLNFPCDDSNFQKGYYKLFEVMAIDLYSFVDDSIDPTDSNDDNNKNNSNQGISNNSSSHSIKRSKSSSSTELNDNDMPFCDIVEDYLFDESTSVLYKKLCTQKEQHKQFYSLTIQPIDDGGSGEFNGFNYFNQKNDFNHFALIFKDIGEEIRQQKMLTEEVLKQNQIINQILPKEIANRLMLELSPIAMTVPNVAISFCDIVSFTPWCGSQTPEVVVTTLNQMFKIFDQMCAKYDQVTKIKCIGDCYMSAAGIFSSNMSQNIINSSSRVISVSGSTTHNYSYNTINVHNSNASLKTNLNVTRFIKKKKRKSPKKSKKSRPSSRVNSSNSNSDVTLKNENENESEEGINANSSIIDSSNENNEIMLSGDDNNIPFDNHKGERTNSLVLNKNKIPFIPNKVTQLPKYMTLHVNPHQRSHSKPTIRPSLFFDKDEENGNKSAFMHSQELSEEHKEQLSSFNSDNPFSTASNFDGETENDSMFTDDFDDNKNSNNNTDETNEKVDNESENEDSNGVNDNIHHSISHLTQNEISAAHQMLSFCLDLLDAIEIVNNQLGTKLQVRVGASFGGPISAGVIGMRMPMFDIWGEIVNEANAMESSGKAMTVHIKKNYYEIVRGEKYIFKPYVNDKGETTYLVTRS